LSEFVLKLFADTFQYTAIKNSVSIQIGNKLNDRFTKLIAINPPQKQHNMKKPMVKVRGKRKRSKAINSITPNHTILP